MVNIDLLHKDASPADTIARIHGILEGVGLRRESLRISWKKAWDHCHSCHLYFRDFPLLMANGKGLTEELTYASALAEYIERLQCRMEKMFLRAGNIYRLPRMFPVRERTARDIRAEVPAVFEQDLRAARDLMAEDFACLPFVDVFGGRVVDLPFEVLDAATGTTGMASGNTPAEALCHALCEVCERYIIRRIGDGTLPGLPTVPIEPAQVRHPLIRGLMEEIRATGLEILVKDGSLGGVLPVLAVALIDRNAGTCAVSFGSDPVFEVALSRCLTEAVQGADRLNHPMGAPAADTPLDICNDPEVLLDRLMDNVGPADVTRAFIAPAGNQDALAFLLERIKGRGRQMYIHDASVLDFPSYYVYVQEMSPDRIPEDHWVFLRRDHEEVRRTIFNIEGCSREDIARTADVLFQELTRADPLLEDALAQGPLSAPVVWWMGIRTLLTAMLMESGEYSKARTVLNWPPSTREPAPEAPDSASGQAFRGLLAGCLAEDPPQGGMPAAPIGRDCPTRPFPALTRRLEQTRARVTNSTDTPWPRLEELPIPRCRDASACSSCPCRKYCFLDEWHRLAQTLRATARPAVSERLLQLIQDCQSV